MGFDPRLLRRRRPEYNGTTGICSEPQRLSDNSEHRETIVPRSSKGKKGSIGAALSKGKAASIYSDGTGDGNVNQIRSQFENFQAVGRAEVLRASATPFVTDHSANDSVPLHHKDIIEGINDLEEDDGLSTPLAELLKKMALQQSNFLTTFQHSGTLKSANAVCFASIPAAESRPTIEETGMNDYDRATDSRRYGFDMGFVTKIMNQEFVFKKSSARKRPSLLSFLRKFTKNSPRKLIQQHKTALHRKHNQLFSLAHRLDRIERAGKYIEAWTTAVAFDLCEDREQYNDMRAIIPNSWLRDAEREVLARPHPTRDRNIFKLEVASKLLFNYRPLGETESAHMISLGSQLNTNYGQIIRDYFKALFEELNALPDNTEMIIEYYPDAQDMITNYTLSDNSHDILNLTDTTTGTKDVLVTSTTRRIVGKLRDMAAHSALQIQTMCAIPWLFQHR